mmetsp:Transcript_11394/g.7901  ORF Transcript_11394/g.7901 Transcript_11394/m.7901 type:complete len:170 (+) Transcript_11394:313-822(+)
MFDDIAAVAEWTAIVAHPQELKKKIERNTPLHIIGLKKDITSLKADLAADEYFQAGEVIGDILTLELGKVKISSEESANVTVPQIYDIATLVSGVVYGLSDQSELVDLSTCLVDADKVEQDVESALGELFHGKIHEAVADLSLAAAALPTGLADCKETGADLKAIEDWL